MKRKIIVIAIIGIFLLTSISVVSAVEMKAEASTKSVDIQAVMANNNEPLNIDIYHGIHQGIKCYIYNEGETFITNVAVISIDFEGRIGTNFETPQILAEELPGLHQHAADCKLSVFGFGSFTVTITVTCDECGDISATASGFIFGCITYIK
ncbi:hypothetical protein MBGDN05_00158 [Thermoplasmatales archaeon SCGC AB-539-N05]|nr:hypothetical protein MBGDN05_00158 [Thermoplasmatales archaeon SCGC AB-539-N05]